MRRTSKETIQKIRQECLNGKSRYKIASELHLSVSGVYKYTKDLPKQGWREPCIRGRSLEVLQQLLNDGYVYTEKNRMTLRKLQKLLPIIKRSQFKSRSIYYLEEKNKLALQEMIKINKNRVIKYSDLTSLSKVFNVKLSRDEKYKFYGKKNNSKLPIIRRKDGGFLSSYHENQMNLDDFMDNNAFLGKLGLEKTRKNKGFEIDSLRENGGSLVDFYIRMYCN